MTIRITSTTDDMWVGRQLGGNNVDIALLHYPDKKVGCHLCVRKSIKDRISETLAIKEGWKSTNCYFFVWVNQTPEQIIDMIRTKTRETDTLVVS
ncbi:hypothetical protein A3K34_02350 [candidate division WWE3 bacterium RIFOXYC1_FULL_40_10]|uniref:Uncharacterized protein n=1 Tax=candidate division WWE3 bacterium RIFOXYA2_FULL_46_9 TaxID=1802636 RepID=A0A1F4VYT0_UNCKA|nr:MAG: hypothetical protein A3K58_02350 [candidate division WWE3 bacterium RIFOXYB1_FULL_40_22]OGC61693.1 MAG: hypothetical protein A3K37_02350 [candidate division WWE3 bacterium RIFOXYA1_FULL_40_11]OGC62322.1 MAG: hypothetical protein A2264_02020 [candidate division WWE3 bacterium RIFOXYA2_FULL_46_9]OGC64868.1 MAG: hypothetical protein A2326_01175 [candidate division WWE3 bacterium RIFOXYB2_FULL_41_6]OGC66076.1 MAG: hypothetical protein A3K34_02350 [candidate division WWE3 bacterium RIFOXYC1_